MNLKKTILKLYILLHILQEK